MAAESPVAVINQKGSQPSVGWSAGQPHPNARGVSREEGIYLRIGESCLGYRSLTIDPAPTANLHSPLRLFFPIALEVPEQCALCAGRDEVCEECEYNRSDSRV